MFDIDDFIRDCVDAAASANPRAAVREVLARAVSDPASVARALPPERGELVPLHVSDELTIGKVVWAPEMSFPPHDHRMWALIGVYSGQEDNGFYRRASGGLIDAGGRQLRDGDVLALGDDAIHAVTNPRRTCTGAIHIYGGAFLTTPRSEWDPVTFEERPFDLQAALRHLEAENAKLDGAAVTGAQRGSGDQR